MSGCPRFARIGKTVLDLVVLTAAYFLAVSIRLEGWVVPAHYARVMLQALPVILVVEYGCLYLCSVPRRAWRYSGLWEAQRILSALALATVVLLVWRLLAQPAPGLLLPGDGPPVPYGVLLINLPLSFLGLSCLRGGVRLWVERAERKGLTAITPKRVPTLLIGAGRAGVLVGREIVLRPDLGIEPLGFLDDDPAKAGLVLQGLPVLGNISQVAEVVGRHGARQALITLVDTGGSALRRIALACEECGIAAKIIPELHEIVVGKVNLSRIRDVAIDDLMRRPAVNLDGEAIAGIVKGRTVLITGAGGSIGSELCRVLCGFQPETLILLEKAENNLFHINGQLAEECPDIKRVACIADICDEPRMNQILAEYRPAAIFHAAAHKHVPLMEANPGEAVKNNVRGTRTLADLASAHGVGVFVMISTDKAVNPTPIMGVSKRVAELYIQALSQRSKTRFVAVRFGNVLGSAGSVIPIFKRQIAQGGPITVTHPEMKRYFMTIPEACQLVLQAGSMGRGGELFILDMGAPVKIVDLARDLIRLSGLLPEKDIEIRFTGVRPGEKLFEELALDEESATRTHHPRIFVGHLTPQSWEEINRHIDELIKLAGSPEMGRLHGKFKEIVPEYEHEASRQASVEPVRSAVPHKRPAAVNGVAT
ncbi:MAG TPA: nucleoside-diphosphate sugar epimerase/dehydratase [Gemmataceae bacterium]|nr:nucleoside-diphosphate sugar epimerase/dehydratase [Gemmataceae bacterium]